MNHSHHPTSPFTAVLVRPIQSSPLATATALPVTLLSSWYYPMLDVIVVDIQGARRSIPMCLAFVAIVLKSKIDSKTIEGMFGHWASSHLSPQTILPCCNRFKRIQTSHYKYICSTVHAGLVYDGPLGLTAVPSKISASLEGQVVLFFNWIEYLMSQLIFLLPEPSLDYLVISDPTSPEIVSDSEIYIYLLQRSIKLHFSG